MWAQPKTGLHHSGASGIEGVVLLSPTCPGPERPDRPCPETPYQGSLVIKRVSGEKEIARTETDKNGRFRVALPPGRYVIVNAPGPVYPRIYSQAIVVRRGRFTIAKIHADTGMR
jgi:hypothetical protein